MACVVASPWQRGDNACRGGAHARAHIRRAHRALVHPAMTVYRRRRSYQVRQRGMALVVAMLLVALAVSTAAAMLLQNDLWTRQLDSLGARAQADVVARAGI